MMATELFVVATLLLSQGNAFLPKHVVPRTTRFGSTMDRTETEQESDYMPASLLPPMYNRPAIASNRLSPMEIQRAIVDVKKFVESRLESDLNLIKHTTPIAFLRGTGVNDELDGTESKSAVRFSVPNKNMPRGVIPTEEMMKAPSPYEMDCEVVQSLAKWKRVMLGRLGCQVGEGIYCDSTSIRKGYKGDVTHSAVADQWDFEIRIDKQQRTVQQLQKYVRTLWKIITDAEDYILAKYPSILLPEHPTADWRLPKEIKFVTAQQLHDEFPNESIHGRENKAVEKYEAIFICGMGWPMADGSPAEEQRSPSYDDWNLNGDIMVGHPLTEYRHELSSMGIRVDKESLFKQLEHRGALHETELDFQKAVLQEDLPFSYGGGIGISRLLMLLLRMGHIGQVQVGLWHDEHYKQAFDAGIDLIPDRIVHYDSGVGGKLAP
ncbi:Aspartate--ammonia ligase [Seminavis robusta]|uniref:Aspartate--ammonia ligase n=1 Tax=Seminavis robusta TaxID=568900 RepID=A0A9N8DD96_9STRA|nr:Aspartate--ammonia ligase [Seminavis robusta]|eukprot:Sro101_g051570.1 Aspartate--ammonia ligase (436) ;mRNA; r:47229-48805